MMMKKQIIYIMCATALLSSCHIYKAYERPKDIDASGLYRDPYAASDTLASTDTTNMGNVPWQEIFKDEKLQALINKGLQNNVDMKVLKNESLNISGKHIVLSIKVMPAYMMHCS